MPTQTLNYYYFLFTLMRRRINITLVLLLFVLGAAAQDVVKVLAIGNSFSQDAVEQYLWNIADANGDRMIIGNMYIGGCSLERHYTNMQSNSASYEYRKVVDGTKTNTTGKTLESALADEQWDYISLQQVSGMSGQYETYEPYLSELIKYVKSKCPQAKIMLHQTWAYAKSSTHADFAKYGKDQMAMYNAIINATTQAFDKTYDNGVKMDVLIPCGTAVQNARTSFIGDRMNRDGYHLNVAHGRYTAACTWYEVIFGKSVVGNTFTPTGVTDLFKNAAQQSAHAAVAKPNEVTDMSWVEGPKELSKYFVCPTEKGKGDGSSWDDAMSLETLSSFLDAYSNGSVFHFAGGVYKPTTRLQTGNGYTFIGGYNPELTGTETPEVQYPSTTPTILSGDKNGNGVADNGDLNIILFINTETPDADKSSAFYVKGFEFTGAYENSASESENHGAVLLRNSGYVKFENCRFYGNKADGKYGGMAITSQYSHLVAENCQFFNNQSKARGAALRFSSTDKSKGYGLIDRCAIYNNKVTEGVGSAILVQHGKALYIVNSTITGNESTSTASGALYSNGKNATYDNKLYIVGSTIAGNKGGSQVELAASAQLYMANSVVVGDDTNKAYNIKGAVAEFKSGGYNVSGADTNLTTWDATDSHEGNTYANVFGSNKLNDQLVIVPLAENSFFSSQTMGDKISTWEIDTDVTQDQLGNQRTDATLAGAYAGQSTPTPPTKEDVTTKFDLDDSYVSRNPMQGWVLYAGLGDGLADDFWQQYDNFQSAEGKVKVSDYATTLFIRAAWTYFNPQNGVYAWQSTCNTKPAQRLKMLVEGAKQRGLKLAFSFMTDSRDKPAQFTPQYVRDAGAKGFTPSEGGYWSPYPDDPVFQQKYEAFLTAFAAEYNDPDLVQFISGTGLGKWGEGHSAKYSTGNMTPRESVFNWITNLHARLFTKVPVVINYHRWILTGNEWVDGQYDANSERLLNSAVEKGFSLRHDAWGMKHYYMEWEKNFVHKYTYKCPVIGEGGWVKASHGGSPMKNDGYADYAAVRQGEFDDAKDAHANMLDFRYNSDLANGETYSWFNEAMPLVKKFIKEGGYHLYPTEVTMPSFVEAETEATMKSEWANSGWGYCPTNLKQWNQKYKVAYALLKNGEPQYVFVDDSSDLSKIVKDDNQTFTATVEMQNVAAGDYHWAVGLVDTTKGNAIGLDISVANTKKQNGWVVLNQVTIGEATGIEGVNGANGSNGSRGSNGSNDSSGVKVLKDGRLVIEKGGRSYTTVGVEIK